MGDIINIATTTLTLDGVELLDSSDGVVIKTIILYNSSNAKKDVYLGFDEVTFGFGVPANETEVITAPIVCNKIHGLADGVNIHISGISL